MKFVLVDRITLLEPGKRIAAVKALSLAEEYLADHFPKFPVLPGVLMLEAMVQTAAWLVRVSTEFRPSLVVLKEARNVTYKSFLAPGQILRLEADCKECNEERSVFATRGLLGEREIVKGQLTLRHLRLADQKPELAQLDERLREQQRTLFCLLYREPAASLLATA